jgi:7-cyano-7-deazaguanine synthase
LRRRRGGCVHRRGRAASIAQIDLRIFGGSALTADIAVPKGRAMEEMGHGIPITYVPARNTIFLSFALAWAEVLGSSDVFIGVNALDYSGYPGLPAGVHRGI